MAAGNIRSTIQIGGGVDGSNVGQIPNQPGSRFEMHPNWDPPIFHLGRLACKSHCILETALKLVEKSFLSLQQLEGCK